MMEFRNARFNRHGTIDCDVMHPVNGWMPTTLSPDDEATKETFAEVSKGEVAPYVAPPERPTFPTLADAEAAMVEWINGLTVRVTSQYPEAERDLWRDQEAAARAFVESGDAAPAHLLDLLDALLIGEGTREQAAAGIIAKADAFREIGATVTRLRRQTSVALQAVDPDTPEQYEAVLNAAMQQAMAKAQKLGLA